MPHVYLVFDFPNEERAQEARHKLEVWKQASRLDKKLLYKFERAAASENTDSAEGPKTEKTAKKSKAKSDGASASAKSEPVKLFVRLGFSGHEKLSEQRFLDRVEGEAIFKAASSATVKANDPSFSETESRFDDLD